ncbi:MAG: PKD domain-containing protein [Microthrixaceae bacterium]|nr:PKD domain-containing protein [Microthrixaceae bacterium]
MKRARWFAVSALASATMLVATGCPAEGGGGGGPTNNPPTVVVAADQVSGTAPLAVAFSSAGTFDPEGSALTFAWSFGDPSSGANNTSTLADPSHTYAAAGTYTAQLTATDASGASASATRTITVSAPVNNPPNAVANATGYEGRAPLTVTFTGDQSSDPEGGPLTYLWDFNDPTSGAANTSSLANPTHTYNTPGLYIATLTVTDAGGLTHMTAIPETVNAIVNQPPVAQGSATPASGKEPLTVAFDADGTSDSDDATNTLTFAWNFGDPGSGANNTAASANASHTYQAAGTYTATLTVTDPLGASDTHTETITVNANQAPVAVANADVTAGQVPLVVNFNSTSSTDDGTIVSRLWNFGGSITSTDANPQFTFGSTGLKTVTLTVTDDNGVSDTDTIQIDVQAIPNVPPVAVGTANPTTAKQGAVVQFTGDTSSDPDNTPGGLDYLWDFGDGSTSTLANPSHDFDTVGTANVQLQVTDAAGGSHTVVVPVEITADAAPTAVASGAPLLGKAPLNVAFSSATTSDPDDPTNTLTFLWTFSGGGSSTEANPSHLFTTAGAHTATLKVTDPFGKFDTTVVNVTVTQNQNPTVVANGSPLLGPEDLTVSFDSTGTADVDDATNTLTYAWDFGDVGSGSNTSTQANPSHTYLNPGTYQASLTVTDPYGGSANSGPITVTVTPDADQDGVSPPSDCNDNDNTVFPGAADPLDATAKDSNCDGADGIVADTVFVSTAGSDANACTLAAPCQTIPRGIAEAGSTKHVVQVSNGSGFGAFTISGTSGLTIRGGFATDFLSRTGTTTSTGGVTLNNASSLKLEFLTIVGPGGTNPTGMFISQGTVTLQNVTVSSGTATGAGSSAYGIRVLAGANVTINGSSISASPGIGGTDGTTLTGTLAVGTPGIAGGGGSRAAVGQQPSIPGGAAPGSGANSGGNGGNGDGSTGIDGAVGGVNGGTGGNGGGNNNFYDEVKILGITYSNSYSGGGGAPGVKGTAGTPGTPGTAGALGYTASGFTPSAPSAGATAGNGGGGGGGGGGGLACYDGACAGTRTSGGAGGGGGGGGQGGRGGTAGTNAGGSFAVLSHNSTIVIDANTTITSGNGGVGGAGGAGQNGAPGGAGGNGGAGARADCCSGAGGSGGSGGGAGADGASGGGGAIGTCCNAGSGGGGGGGGGGNGGKGGTGGGGAGGPSVGLMKVGTGAITFGGNQATQITIGTGGAGGAAPGGNAGATGTTAKMANA